MSKSLLVVVEEHTLGVVNPRDPARFTPVMASVLRGAPCGLLLSQGTAVLPPDGKTVRRATRADLDAFRVFLSETTLERHYAPLEAV